MKKVKQLKFICLLLITVILAPSVQMTGKNASAATVYISVEDFAKALAKELGLKSIKGDESSGFVNALMKEEIIKKGEISNYTKDITRTDLMLLLNRADEYLYGETLEEELVQLVIDQRISDISKVKAAKRKDVAKAYLKGFIKGYTNGAYSSNRQIRGGNRISRSAAIECVKMLKNKSLRAKLSPDGQLLRTSNLPKNAKKFPYILASYPNAYYEKSFAYEGVVKTVNGKKVDHINYVDYAAPVDIDKIKQSHYEDFPTIRKTNLYDWVGTAKTHVNLIFNVDYRNIGNEWIQSVYETESNYGIAVYEDKIKDELKSYIKKMKQVKTVVECNNVAIDGSSLYFYNEGYYLRAYVKYRIVTTDIPSVVSVNTYLNEKPFEKILYSRNFVNLNGFQKGKWVEGIFDIRMNESWTTTGRMGVVSIFLWDKRKEFK